jgi:hypothetical protein
MTLKNQIKLLTEFFNREKLDYAVIGAFALYAYGYTRATRDIDFITRSEYQDKIIGYLESLGFKTLNRSQGYSNHLSPMGSVRIDFVYINGETAKVIFGALQKRSFLIDSELPVVSPEHLIALKIFAIKNDPDRKFKELADIEEILKNTPVDKEVIRQYFRDYGFEDYFDEIAGK